MSATVTLYFVVGLDYLQGDYCQLHSNDGSGDIDWDTPVNSEKLQLFDARTGNYGWGHAPWGHFPWGHMYSMNTLGWGHLPWGHFPWGHGANIIEAKDKVYYCGDYVYGFKACDKVGNAHTGTPETVELAIHIAPPEPGRLKKNSYDKETDVLILDVA